MHYNIRAPSIILDYMGKLQLNLLIKGTYKDIEKRMTNQWLFNEIYVFSDTIKKLRSGPIKTVPIKLMAIIYGQIIPHCKQSTFILG